MRKTYCKTGLLVVMACLSLLAAGFISSGNVMASHRHHHVHRFMQRPHIILKMLPNTTRYDHQDVARAVIYGVGFDNCSNCGADQDTSEPCDTGCNAPAPSYTPSPCDTGCTAPTPTDTPSPCETGCTTTHQDVTDKVITTDVQTTTTTTTTTNVNVSHHSIGCTASCTPLPPNTVPCTPCNNNTPSNYNNAPSNTNNNTPNYNNGAPNATCPSYNNCGTGSNNSGTGSNNSGTGSSNSGCNCSSDNTANLQGNVPFTAPGINLSRIPVNTFGEFRVGVNIRMTPRQARTRPSFWATNSYNAQRSDTTSAPCCSSAFCCQ